MENQVAEEFSIIEALALLTPYDVDKSKVRVGPDKDGAYVLIPELLHGQPVLSYGIDGEYRFDLELASRGHQIFMFDHTIEGINNPGDDPKLFWIKEGVDGREKPEELLNTIENHVKALAPDAPDLLLKMDVEGCEYDAFDTLPVHILMRFSQILFEVHALHSLDKPEFRAKFVRVFTKLNRYFTLFHVHANNFDGENTYTFLGGVPVANLIELSFVRSDLVSKRKSTTLYPTALDYPNVHPKDKKLWFFPFLPTGDDHDFAAADRRMELVATTHGS